MAKALTSVTIWIIALTVFVFWLVFVPKGEGA